MAKAAQSNMAKEEAQCSSTNSTANREKPNQHTGRETFAEEGNPNFEKDKRSVVLLLSGGRVT